MYWVTFHHWDLSTSSTTTTIKWLSWYSVEGWTEPPEPRPGLSTGLMGKPDSMCGVLLWAALLFSHWKKNLTSMKHTFELPRPNRKGGYIGYSMTCVSRSRCIWSFKSFCLKDLVLRGGTAYDTLAGPLINWNQFFKGNHKSSFLFPSCRAMLMAPFKVGLSTFFHHYC